MLVFKNSQQKPKRRVDREREGWRGGSVGMEKGATRSAYVADNLTRRNRTQNKNTAEPRRTIPALRCMLLCRLLRHLLSSGAITERVARSTRMTKVVASRASSVLSVSSGLAITLTRRSTCRCFKTKDASHRRQDKNKHSSMMGRYGV